MKKLRYRMLTVILSAAFFFALLLLMRTGGGAAKLAGAKLSAFLRRGNISIAENTAEKMAVPPLPKGKREFTCEDFDHIFINGERYDFPLRYNELPKEFSLKLASLQKDKEAEKRGKVRYNFMYDLYYNDLHWATGISYSDNSEADPNNVVINIFIFIGTDKSKYLPQVIIGGLDVYDTDPVAVDRVYGYGMEDYYCSQYRIDAEDRNHIYIISLSNDSVGLFGYYDIYSENIIKNAALTKEEYYLPEDYSPEADKANSSLKYKPVPEKNGGLQLALENLTLYGKKIKLPCTVNSLLYTLKDTGAYIDELDYARYQNEYDLFKVSGGLKTNYGDSGIDFLFAPGKGIGEGQVISISVSGKNSDNIEIPGIDKGDPSKSDERYGVTYNEDDKKYMITDYEYNNIFIWEYGDIEVSYWGENLTAVGED